MRPPAASRPLPARNSKATAPNDSQNPGANTLGGLTANPFYNTTYSAANPISVTGSGNRFVYSLAATLTYTVQNAVRLYGGGSRREPRIFFSGFWSQGDGACWEGFYSYGKNASAEIRSHAPQDTALHGIADALQAIQRRNFYQLRAEASHRGRYYHEYCMAISVERDSQTYQDMTADAEEIVIEALRDLARWLYRQLEREYDYLSSGEAVDETITANEYTFTKAGRRFG